MRILAVILLTAATLAGCATSPATTDDAPVEDVPDAGDLDARNQTLAGLPEFCNDNATCKFWDDHFHEYVVYDLDTYVFDVVIVPPVGASTPDNIAASRQAVQAWRDGILEYAQPWLKDVFEVNVYAVGIDIPSIDAVQDPDIIVISSAAEFLIGIGLEPKQLGCILLGEVTLQELGGHEHNGNRIFAQDCTGIGFTCFALNVGAMDPRGLYDLIAHEVGHCLGAGHVGDAGDFRARYAPIEDIMSYQDNPAQVHCVSNLNVRVLEGVYAHLLDRPEEEFLPRGSYYAMPPEAYAQVECANPPGM